MRGGKGRHLELGCLGVHDDHDLRAVLSRADEGDGTKVRVQKGRRLDRPAINYFDRAAIKKGGL